jgi:hypothetical protein
MTVVVERVQTGVRLEKRLLKVLKATAEYLDLSLGDLLEGIVLHAFDGLAPFRRETLAEIAKLRSVYGLALAAGDSHQLVERRSAERQRRPRKRVTRGSSRSTKRRPQ